MDTKYYRVAAKLQKIEEIKARFKNRKKEQWCYMANIIDNLKVGTPENNKNIKTILIKLHKDSDWQKLKEFFFNGVLI